MNHASVIARSLATPFAMALSIAGCAREGAPTPVTAPLAEPIALTPAAAMNARCEHACTDVRGWQLFTSAEGGFAVAMPRAPEESMVQRSPIEMHLFEVEVLERATVYAVAYTDYPPELVDAAHPERTLDLSRDSLVRGADGDVEVEHSVDLAGVRGREVKIAAREIVIVARLFAIGSRAIEVSVRMPELTFSDDEAARYLATFRLLAR